ncbi:uncharacterized protein ACN427_014436 isoform 1-T2 [Glossina fuscipes fuscipes]
MMDNDDLIILVMITGMMCEYYRRRCRYKKRFWVRPLYKNRDVDGFFVTAFDHMYNNDFEQFKVNVRMNPKIFDLLLNLTEEKLTKSSCRPSISAKCRLFLTLLRYLAKGESVRYLSLTFKMGASTVRSIIQETSRVLWDVLAPFYMSLPNKSGWERIAVDFETIWNLPHCVGAIDVKHISIVRPANSGSQYYKNKGTCSIVLLAVCGANYIFTAVDVGACGPQGDHGIMCHSEFVKRLVQNQLELPEATIITGTNIEFPYYFIGDSAFPLRNNLIKPYPGILLPKDKETFNKRLSRGRKTIENALGVLASRWRVLLSPIHMKPENAASVVKATVVLHNFVKMHDESYCPREYVDSEENGELKSGLWRKNTAPLRKASKLSGNNASRSAFHIRDILKNYLSQNGI